MSAPAPDVSVVIAYRDLGCPYRAASFAYVHDWYERLGWQIVVEAGDDTFTRASAINTAVRRCAGRVIVQSDPDSLVPAAALRQAVTLADAEDGLVIPHDRYLYLTRDATATVLSGRSGYSPGAIMDLANCDTSGADGSGNVVVFSRATWHTAGGFDERFGLWGGDDAAFAYAAQAYYGPVRRLAGDVVHLWHPRLPQSVPGSPGFVEQFAVLAQYRDAAALGPQAVRDLVESRGR